MAGTPSRMNQSAREQILSTDLNRIGNLAGREMMDAAQERSVRADFYNPSTNTFEDFAAVSKAAQGTPIAGLTKAPSLDGIAAQFNMNIGAGEAQMPSTPTNPDLSGYELLRWAAQTITWPIGGTPDATNPRICLIVATPADVLTDVLNRNILLDPATRVVSPQPCYKTSNPVATLSVVVGAAAAAPVAPAVPAGTLAIFEVYVPPVVADSTFFLAVRRAWRQIDFPGTSQHGILKDCVPQLNTPSAIGLKPGIHRLVIDGELLTVNATAYLPVIVDSAHIPGSAPATYDMPVYLYLCGGRNQPVSRQTFAGNRVPLFLIVTTVAPDELGYPSATLAVVSIGITFPRAACCYVGLCFYGASGTSVVPSFYDGDWIHSSNTVTAGGLGTRAFLEPLQTGAIVNTPFALSSKPSVSTACRLQAMGNGGAGIIKDGGGDFLVTGVTDGYGTHPVYLGTASMAALVSNVAGGATMRPSPTAYNMNIPRLAR